MTPEGLEVGYIFGDVDRAPAPIVAPVPSPYALCVRSEAVTSDIGLEQIALNTMVNEDTTHIRNQNLFSIFVHLGTLGRIAHQNVGICDQLIELRVRP